MKIQEDQKGSETEEKLTIVNFTEVFKNGTWSGLLAVPALKLHEVGRDN